MRRLFFSLIGLAGLSLCGGCMSTGGHGCGDGCAGGGCGAGGCASGGCGAGGFGAGAGLGGRDCSWTHGVCDCTIDEYCMMRSPWIVTPAYATATTAVIPATPPAKVLPKGGLE
jgi:hypothetical protein